MQRLAGLFLWTQIVPGSRAAGGPGHLPFWTQCSCHQQQGSCTKDRSDRIRELSDIGSFVGRLRSNWIFTTTAKGGHGRGRVASRGWGTRDQTHLSRGVAGWAAPWPWCQDRPPEFQAAFVEAGPGGLRHPSSILDPSVGFAIGLTEGQPQKTPGSSRLNPKPRPTPFREPPFSGGASVGWSKLACAGPRHVGSWLHF